MQNESNYNELPFITCPACDKEWQQDDWYEVERGDQFHCHHCEEVVIVTSVDYRTIIDVAAAGRKVEDPYMKADEVEAFLYQQAGTICCSHVHKEEA